MNVNKEMNAIENMKGVTSELSEYLLNDANRISESACDSILKKVNVYEKMLMELVSEMRTCVGGWGLTELNREKSGWSVSGPCQPALPAVSGVPMAPVASASVARVARPSYALVVKGKENETNESVLEKLKSTAASSGVRVKSVRFAKSGGVVLETVSASEREKLKTNESLRVAGLNVSEPKRMLPRVIVYDVPNALTDKEFMSELYSKNVKDVCGKKEWKDGARIAVRQSREGASLGNVVLEVPHVVRDSLVRERRVYVGWGVHRVNVYEKISRCYGCFQYGHLKHEYKSECLCRKCGKAGHKEASCSAPPNCVNCSARKREAGHSAMSDECPEYVWRLERLRARVNSTSSNGGECSSNGST